ncbi:AtpZ/AtpI family protein [Alteribacter aurantiacus]|uniref:AtpZ/AtpI family protein n=1 Tax=Alteribacter aurantiacus TaxID=254410 RepID=UPI0003FD1D68|nr:AtpZ/AtpI family protein [Alteribacter aurantiacus]
MAENSEFRSLIRKMAIVGSISSYLLVTILIGVFGGLWLDGHFGTNGLYLILGFILGLGAGAYGVFSLVKRFMGDDK